MKNELKRYLERFVQLSEQELNHALDFFEYAKVPKNTLILESGKVCNFEAYIISGCAREYFVDKKGNEHTVEFAIEDWWISEINSFENSKPSKVSIETLEETELLMLSLEAKQDLLDSVPQLERMFRIMMQRHVHVLKNRMLLHLSGNAMDRFQMFLNQYPTVVQRVPQYHIASYLGISKEFLSKLRKRVGNSCS
ncbi:Crp/Fnr family transcriptional regulator [Flagellimonas oceanensis]|uniref:Crp/Fnr family transcriptional regulator n=1 Tax=Flagellimonas oceanensis TaxID=2499163 RepID=UPI003BA84748